MLEERSFFLWEKEDEVGRMRIKRVDLILKDGEEVSRRYHRHVINPDSDISNATAEIKAITKAFWTKEVKDKWKEEKEKTEKEEKEKIKNDLPI